MTHTDDIKGRNCCDKCWGSASYPPYKDICVKSDCPCHSTPPTGEMGPHSTGDGMPITLGNLQKLAQLNPGIGGESEGWQIEFDKLFPTLSVSTKNADKLGYNLVHRTQEVKDFIRQEKQKSYEEAVMKTEEACREMIHNRSFIVGRAEEWARILKVIEEMKYSQDELLGTSDAAEIVMNAVNTTLARLKMRLSEPEESKK